MRQSRFQFHMRYSFSGGVPKTLKFRLDTYAVSVIEEGEKCRLKAN